MKKNRTGPQPKDLDTLRRRAEERLHEQGDRLDALSARDIRELIYEMGTYQIELEMQNEELRNAQQEIETSRRMYADLYDFAPIGYFTLSDDGQILQVNLTGADLLGMQKRLLVGNKFFRFVEKNDLGIFQSHCLKVLETHTAQNCEIRMKKIDGTPFFARLQSISATDDEREAALIRTAASDITELKLTAEALKDSEEKYRSLVELSPDAVAVQREEKFVYINPAGAALFGASDPNGIIGQKVLNLIHPDDREMVKERIKLVMEKGEQLPRTEAKIIRLDGKPLDVEAVATPIIFKGERAVQVIIKDITERKNYETRILKLNEELEQRVAKRTEELARANRELRMSREMLRNLYLRQQDLIEVERTGIAREIHDDLGQLLTGVGMELSRLGKNCKDKTSFVDRIQSISGLIDSAVKTINAISVKLRPQVLDILGLVPAMERHAREFSERYSIDCKVDFPLTPPSLNKEDATALFRIFQEALTNVARHANAIEVDVHLRIIKNTVVLKIRDNGRGITKKQLDDVNSFGIMGMRERVVHLGGSIMFRGTRGKGTTVTVILPIKKGGSDAA